MYAREKDFPSKQECSAKENKNTLASTSSRWTGIKDPRIVRVSRTFGGKDRHSKVCTVKGLRDRRVRLSMPTAIQLYDLQDRLGLNQPSKVVDWLLNAARVEIDKLPPLQMPPGNFGQFLQSMVVSQEVSATKTSLASLVGANMEYGKVDGAHSLLSHKGGIKINNNVDGEEQPIVPKSTYWNLESRTKHKEVERETIAGKNNWIKRNEEEYQEGIEAGHSTQVPPPQNSFPKANHSSEAGLLNSAMPHNSYYHLEPSNLSLSHLGSQGYSYQTEDPHSYNVVPLPSSLSLPSGSQILLCPSGTTPSFFPPYVTTPVDCGTRQINHFQMLSPSSQNLLPNSLTPSLYSINPPMRPFQLSITPKLLYPQNNNGIQSNRDDGGPLSTPTASFFQNDPKAT